MKSDVSQRAAASSGPGASQRGSAPLHGTRAGRPFLYGRWVSVRAALSGARYTLRTQPNAWIELAALVVVMGAAWYFRVDAVEWAILILTIFAVLALEAVNTAIEAVVDLVTPEYHPLARVAKDAAAGALIFLVLSSILVAAVIFGPRLLGLFR